MALKSKGWCHFVVQAASIEEAREIWMDFERVRIAEEQAYARITYAQVPDNAFWQELGGIPPVVFQVRGPKNADWKVMHEVSRPTVGKLRELLSVFPTRADLEREKDEELARLERDRQDPPRTMDEAVEALIGRLRAGTLEKLCGMEEDELPRMHFGLGLWIRNAWLYPNPDLVRACGGGHVDSVSSRIIRAAWQQLRRNDAHA